MIISIICAAVYQPPARVCRSRLALSLFHLAPSHRLAVRRCSCATLRGARKSIWGTAAMAWPRRWNAPKWP